MASSDAFDEFDELFADGTELDRLEVQALQSSQAPSKHRITEPYHHTVARPKAGPTRPSNPALTNFGGRKEPAPLNTEPRAGVGGFGWEYGGKRSMEGNVERHIQSIKDRQAYRSHGPSDLGKTQVEEEYPDVVMTTNGGYGFDEGEVLDDHIRTGAKLEQASQARQTKAAVARRDAIAQAEANSKKSTDPDSVQGQDQRFPSSSRVLARSVSAGHHAISKSTKGLGPQLSPIPSQSSSKTPPLPASQGSLARKSALELEDERRRREAAEEELSRVRAQVAEYQRQLRLEREAKEREEEMRAIAGPSTQKVPEDAEVSKEDLLAKFKDMQDELWKAKGEAETIRRGHREEHDKHLAEVDKMRMALSDMNTKLRERDKDASRLVENVKTQAVFANHAARNSAIKARAAASQRPVAATPISNGSPKGKNANTSLIKTDKGKGKAQLPPPPAPRFQTLNNAFATSPTVTRSKRQQSEIPIPAQSSPPTQAPSPRTTPQKRAKTELDAEPSSAVLIDNDIVMDYIQAGALNDADTTQEPDHKAQLLHHLFNHIPLSPFQTSMDPHGFFQPTFYRLLNYRPPITMDPDGRFAKSCTDILRACGDSTISFDEILDVLAKAGSSIIQILHSILNDAKYLTYNDIAASINIFVLLGKTAWLFQSFASHFGNAVSDATTTSSQIVSLVYATPEGLSRIEEVLNGTTAKKDSKAEDNPTERPAYGMRKRSLRPAAPDALLDPRRKMWFIELAEAIGSFAQAICWCGMYPVITGAEIVDIAMGLTRPHLDHYIISYGVDFMWAAALHKDHLHLIMNSTANWVGSQCILERMGRLLVDPPSDASEVQVHRMMLTIIKALSMLSMSDRDAVLLVGEKSLVIPALILLLRRESSKVWGVWIDSFDVQSTLNIIQSALSLLHHLIYPIPLPRQLFSTYPTQSQSNRPPAHFSAEADPELEGDLDDKDLPQGVNFVQRLREVGSTFEFNGIAHQFISTLGVMSYGAPAIEVEKYKEVDIGAIQEMSQDVLEALVEGPEGDAVFELYEEADDVDQGETGELSGGKKVSQREREGEGEVDMEVYDAIPVEDEDL